jgi:branched-subunit amino acid aminotransferase/4-amino-4-deoxychorismate lyase
VPHRLAVVHIEDRGYQFADGVYEVLAVVKGHIIDEEPHLVRLARSLSELRIAQPISDAALKIVMRETIRRNRVHVTAEGTVVTRQAGNAILNGIVRLAVLDIVRRESYSFVERPFTVSEAKAASEAFLTSTTLDLLPVVRIDGEPVGSGMPGPLSRKLRDYYLAHTAAAG